MPLLRTPKVNGNSLDAGERILWRRWLDDENRRLQRRVRVVAPCCGYYRYSYQFEQDIDGTYYCLDCWASARSEQQKQVPQEQGLYDNANAYAAAAQHAEHRPQETQTAPTGEEGKEEKHTTVDSATNPNEAPVKITPPWRRESQEESPSKRQRVWQYVGVVDRWLKQKNYGFALFEGFDELVFIHGTDIDRMPSAGEMLEGVLERRPDGRLQAKSVIVRDVAKKDMQEMDQEKIHETLLGLV